MLVALTGWNVPEAEWREAGFDFHLSKPVAAAAIKNLLKSQPASGTQASGRIIH